MTGLRDRCVQERHGDQRPEALPSLRLCRACYNRLKRDLSTLGRLYVELENALPAGSTPQHGQRVTGSSTRPLPVNPAVADLRDQIRHDLAWWARYVADRRGLTPPTGATVPALARWLAGHTDWIAAHDEAAAACPPVARELAGRARALAYPSGARRITIGPCVEEIDGERCGGTVYATVRQDDDPRPSRIYCPECGLEKGAEEWRRFGREYQRERRMAG